MKKILTMAMIATLGLSGFANAMNENVESLTDVKNSNNRVKVILKEGLGKVKLEVIDPNGKTLHHQTVMVKNDMMVPYNLSELPVGNYKLKIESGSKSNTEVAYYKVERKLTKEEMPLMAYRKDLDHDTIKLTVIGLDEPGVKVQIFDKSGKEVHKEEIRQPEAFSKTFQLVNLNSKDVSIQVTDSRGRQRYL